MMTVVAFRLFCGWRVTRERTMQLLYSRWPVLRAVGNQHAAVDGEPGTRVSRKKGAHFQMHKITGGEFWINCHGFISLTESLIDRIWICMTGLVRFIVASLLSFGSFLVVAMQGIASWQLWLGMRVAMAVWAENKMPSISRTCTVITLELVNCITTWYYF